MEKDFCPSMKNKIKIHFVCFLLLCHWIIFHVIGLFVVISVGSALWHYFVILIKQANSKSFQDCFSISNLFNLIVCCIQLGKSDNNRCYIGLTLNSSLIIVM